jgi:aspartokinase-like uncharacterized kinase
LKILQPFPLERWLSTDTSSAYFSNLVNAKIFIKLTNVDWVYKDLNDESSLINEIYTNKLKQMWKTCVCTALPDYLDKTNSNCYVLNWYKTGNLSNFLLEWKWIFTKIISSNWF